MAIPATTIDFDLEAVKAAIAVVEPRPGLVLLFGSRARGDGRPDSDLDLLLVMPQATLTPQERQQALRSLRAVQRPLSSSVGEDWGWQAGLIQSFSKGPIPVVSAPSPAVP